MSSIVKMRAPENFGSLTLAGRAVEIGNDGSCRVDHRDVATLQAHGFMPWDAPAKDVRTMTRGELVEHIVRHVRADLDGMDTEEMRRRALECGEADQAPTDAELAAAKVEAGSVTPERIGEMNRPELFAYLKAEGVSAAPPVTNDRLREIALDTLKRKQAA